MKTSTKILITLLVAVCFSTKNLQAQNTFPSTGSAGIGTTTPNGSSALEIKSTTQGLLISRMTKAQRDAIATPATGLMIYQTNSTPGFYYYSGTAWTAVTVKSKGWSLTGNAGTVSGTNFIGTTDAQPLMFKVNNTKAGYIDFDALKANTGFGHQSLYSNTIGNHNTAQGYSALFSNTAGSFNISNGNFTLYSNTTGGLNTANGYIALHYNTTGSYNTANGEATLYSNTTGSNNTANGIQSLYSNTVGYSNVAVGVVALWSNTNRSNLVAIGDSALFNNGIGAINSFEASANTAIGSKALYSNTTGYNNTANGMVALSSNTTGSYNSANGYQALAANTTGSYNTANGQAALYSNTTGTNNTASGLGALLSNATGINNTANGLNALYSNTTGGANTASGLNALYSNATGNYNSALGYYANVSTGNLSNATVIGSYATVDASNKIRVGDDNVTSIGGHVGWSTFSDGRYKKNVKEDVKGLIFINSLRPVTYTVDINGLNTYYDKGRKHDSAYEKIKADMKASADEAAKIVYNGFIAQDVEAAAKKINYDFSGVDKPKNKDGLYGLRYSDFVVPLVKAVQELSNQNEILKDENDEQKKVNDAQQKINEELRQMILSLQQTFNNCNPCAQQSAIINQKSENKQSTNLSNASLEQNIPNPFNNTTTINYTLPQTYSSAKFIVVDDLGKAIKSITLSGTGKGSINFSSPFRAGASYNYSLYVDGKLIDTKQMILAK